jgi:hypothetical protein
MRTLSHKINKDENYLNSTAVVSQLTPRKEVANCSYVATLATKQSTSEAPEFRSRERNYFSPYSLLPDEKKYSLCIYDVAPLRMSSG